MATRTDWTSTVPPRSAAAAMAVPAPQAAHTKPPPIPASASGPQLVSTYTPPENELNFIKALRCAPEQRIRNEMVDLIECVQFRKVEGEVQIPLTDGERIFVHETATRFDVDLMFSLD